MEEFFIKKEQDNQFNLKQGRSINVTSKMIK